MAKKCDIEIIFFTILSLFDRFRSDSIRIQNYMNRNTELKCTGLQYTLYTALV